MRLRELRVFFDGQFQFGRSEEHTSELQSRENLVCRLLLEKKKTHIMEFFRPVNACDLVIGNPTSSKHTLHGTASTEADTYTWVVNLTIERSLIRNSTH